MNGATKKQAIYDRLAMLAAGGRLTPEEVVADAKKKTSPLHDEFEWDDSVAAHQYRKEQARKLIQSCRVYIERSSYVVSAPSYVRDPDAATHEPGYRSTVDLKSDREKALQALQNEADRAYAYMERVRSLAVALDLEDDVEEVMSRFTAFVHAISQ